MAGPSNSTHLLFLNGLSAKLLLQDIPLKIFECSLVFQCSNKTMICSETKLGSKTWMQRQDSILNHTPLKNLDVYNIIFLYDLFEGTISRSKKGKIQVIERTID